MIRPRLLSALLGTLLASTATADDAPRPDLLRLTNGELEGRFGGLDRDGILRWERDDGVAPMEFRTDKIRQIILRGGHSQQADAETSHVELVNGDRIPGTISSLDDVSLTLESRIAGPLVIPRDAVRRISPNPFGGRLVYAGPFDPEAWKTDDGRDPKPAAEDAAETEEGAPAEDIPEATAEIPAATEEKAPASGWQHLGSRWYRVSGTDAITLDPGMPRRSIFRFRLEWRGRSPISIGFHADFAHRPPEDEEADGEDEGRKRPAPRIMHGGTSGLTGYFGRALVLTLRGNYVSLYRCGFGDDGQPFADSLRSSNRTLNVEETGDAEFELRTDLGKGFISLFVNGEFSMQWQIDPPDEADDKPWLPGTGIGFRVDGDQNPLRVSDIIVAEWNGMPDSARSLENEQRDVVLLTNGTDRVSGKVTSITDGNLRLDGPYAPLVIPVADIADIRFATDAMREAPASSEGSIRVHFQPIGRISGSPGPASRNGTMTLKSLLLGDLSISLESAAILEFRQGGSFLDAWDDDF